MEIDLFGGSTSSLTWNNFVIDSNWFTKNLVHMKIIVRERVYIQLCVM